MHYFSSAADRVHVRVLQAKQRASIRWLVAKAYNNQVPTNLREPYYRDQSDVSTRPYCIRHGLC